MVHLQGTAYCMNYEHKHRQSAATTVNKQKISPSMEDIIIYTIVLATEIIYLYMSEKQAHGRLLTMKAAMT